MNWWQRFGTGFTSRGCARWTAPSYGPALLEQAGGNIDVARRAFRNHARKDTAYSYMSPNELDRYINELPPE
jgi:hypothetical protein